MNLRFIKWSIGELALMVKKRQENEFDANIVVDGPRGNGKSTFTFKLFSRIGNFNPQRDIMFSREDVMEALRTRRYGLIDADEMINSAHNREFFSGDQNELIRMMNMYRDHYNVLAGCVPYFYDLDKQVRKLIKTRVTIIKRGLAVVQFSRSSLYTNDPWDTEVNKKIESAWIRQWKKGKMASPQYHKLTTFAGYMTFGKLHAAHERLYKELKQKKRIEFMDKKDTEQNMDNKRGWFNANQIYESLYKQLLDGKLSQAEAMRLAQLNLINETTLRINILKRLRRDGYTEKLADFWKDDPKKTFTDGKNKINPISLSV